ncbi:hypothetical protein BAUCODRAFT_31942 [Baudoinia panamericana UAMH 10762]|uniref:Major facilitator superfamily (MFS) profile domain-containing protein n=1 Tax=Baudoinia panamericana (strain UAMH 10762) TaxID=717646 RepID=M2NFB1_BAUPA|nr:uncharacterized protein BAUCODRAFT_31942 [Baudoinia panamericana UAMH 10762]EMC97934.1 hypothetical protein BAUCODRAFT_31942 [Baudoinia panamericana UAMH 10762]
MSWKAILHELDLLGTVALVPAITCLFLALTWAGTKYAYNSATVLGLFVGFGLLSVAFVYDQCRKQDSATLPPRIIKRRSIIAGFIFSACCNGSITVLEYYMPTYFQTVRGWSPAKSGLLIMPIIGGFLVGMLVHGVGTTLIGFYTPFMLISSTLMPIAAGLMTTWTLQTQFAKLVAYSALSGFASGVGFQGPQSAVQVSLSDVDGPLGLSVKLFGQNFGPALFISIAQAIFTNRLGANLHNAIPGSDAKALENMGFSELVASVGPQNVGKVLAGFDRSITQTWYLPLGATCLTMVGSLLMEWRSVKEKRN